MRINITKGGKKPVKYSLLQKLLLHSYLAYSFFVENVQLFFSHKEHTIFDCSYGTLTAFTETQNQLLLVTSTFVKVCLFVPNI